MTPEQFDAQLAKLKKSNPSHDMIPVIEERGYDFLSVEYLKLSLQDPVEKIEPEMTLDTLHAQKSSLYSKRAQLSNKFHGCTSDKERKEVSIAIGSIQTQIITVRRALDEYFNTGRLPKAPERLVLPIDGRRQELQKRSYMSSLSRFRGQLRQEQDPEKIKHIEQRIDSLQQAIRELSA